jgi:predicted DsbA family dithiol-disulfide isomerase
MNLPDQDWTSQADRDAGERPFLVIEAFFDFICLWCLIGKRNLDTTVSRIKGAGSVTSDTGWRGR